MKNNQLLPFQRNRYYPGKVLTSMDFAAEQQYMNNKRRFINHVVFGSGVICGLSVINLDDLSVLIESGAAIDGQGREIVVDKSVVHKLSALKGYEDLKTDRAILYIRYKEEEVHPVYCAVAEEGEAEYQYNRMDERYELFLEDKESEEHHFSLGDDYLLQEMLADTKDYAVTVSIPAIVSQKQAVKLEISIKKKSEEKRSMSLNTTFQLPLLQTAEGSHELTVKISNMELKKGETQKKAYWLRVEETDVTETNLVIKNGVLQMVVDGKETEIHQAMNLKITLSKLSPDEIASQELGKLNLEMRSMGQVQHGVPLAELLLLQTDVTYLIGHILDKESKNYINTPAQMNHRIEFLSYFNRIEGTMQLPLWNTGICPKEQHKEEDVPVSFSGGRVEIPLKPNMRKGDICLSEEIIHGLGPGAVYVDVGIVATSEEADAPYETESIIYGDSSLFKEKNRMRMQTAVKVFSERGSFQIAAKLLGEQKSIVLLMDWTALRRGSQKETKISGDIGHMRIVPETPTVRLAVKGTYFFQVRFEHMEPCPLSYEVMGNNSGEITEDGVYTAPVKKGVYEIHIYCRDMPKISTYAYAIVQSLAADPC